MGPGILSHRKRPWEDAWEIFFHLGRVGAPPLAMFGTILELNGGTAQLIGGKTPTCGKAIERLGLDQRAPCAGFDSALQTRLFRVLIARARHQDRVAPLNFAWLHGTSMTAGRRDLAPGSL